MRPSVASRRAINSIPTATSRGFSPSARAAEIRRPAANIIFKASIHTVSGWVAQGGWQLDGMQLTAAQTLTSTTAGTRPGPVLVRAPTRRHCLPGDGRHISRVARYHYEWATTNAETAFRLPQDAPLHGKGGALNRRCAIGAISGGLLFGVDYAQHIASAADGPQLAKRLSEKQPMGPTGRLTAPWAQQRMLYFPQWLEGKWQVTSTNVGFATPQGPRFVPVDVREEANADLGSSVQYSLRFIHDVVPPGPFSRGEGPRRVTVADRPHNIKAVTNAFQGFEAVSAVDYDPGDPGRITANFATETPDGKQLPPRRIEVYINHAEGEEGIDKDGNPAFYTSELFRQVYIGVRQVEVNDYEICMGFSKLPDGTIAARQRNVVYLQPQDAAYFDAGGNAVAYYDYDLAMVRGDAA